MPVNWNILSAIVPKRSAHAYNHVYMYIASSSLIYYSYIIVQQITNETTNIAAIETREFLANKVVLGMFTTYSNTTSFLV